MNTERLRQGIIDGIRNTRIASIWGVSNVHLNDRSNNNNKTFW